MIIYKTPADPAEKFNADTLDNKHLNEILFVGTIIGYVGNVIPENWMLCAGNTLLQEAYPELFAVINVSYGFDKINDFKIPDLRGAIPGINFIIKVT